MNSSFQFLKSLSLLPFRHGNLGIHGLAFKAILSMVLLLNFLELGNCQLVIDVDTTFNNSTLTVTPPHGLFVTHTSNDPLLTMTNGATTSGVQGVVVGLLTGESGQLLIENGSSIVNSGSGSLGTFGSYPVARGDAYLGLNTGSTGLATVTGTGASWINSGTMRVGRSGFGELTINNGGFVSNTFGNIGVGVGSEGTVVVSNSGSAWSNTFLNVGFNGIGDLTILGGGSVSASNATQVGVSNGAIGTISIGNGGSQLTGTSGTIGVLNGSQGFVGVIGTWELTDTLTIGSSGVGSLTILSGGRVSNDTIGRIGFNTGSNGTVDVTGSGSLWEIGDQLSVGAGGTGNLNVSSGGKVVVGSDTFVGEGVFISTDGLLVLGAGGNINTSNLVNNGGTTITGAGASWVIDDTLRVGQSNGSNGALNVENGGFLSNTSQAIIAGDAGSEGIVTVTGAGSQWRSNGNVSIGSQGVGSLIVESNGQVVVGNGSYSGGGVFISTGSELFLGDQGDMNSNLIVVDGALTGFGLAEGDMQVNGLLSPGNSAGTIKVRGNVSIRDTATVCIEIGGNTPGLNYDVLDGSLTSNLNLGNSRLELSLINGFVPDQGQQFVFLQNFESITGVFGNSGDGEGQRIQFAGGSFEISYGVNSIFLSDFQAVPEPAFVSLVLLAGLMVANRRRRK